MDIIILFVFFGPPAIFFLWLLMRLNGDNRKGLGWAFLLALYTALSGQWDISHSQSSTAGLGYFFLPWYCMMMGAFGLGFGKFRSSNNKVLLALGYLCLILALCYIGLDIRDKLLPY